MAFQAVTNKKIKQGEWCCTSYWQNLWETAWAISKNWGRLHELSTKTEVGYMSNGQKVWDSLSAWTIGKNWGRLHELSAKSVRLSACMSCRQKLWDAAWAIGKNCETLAAWAVDKNWDAAWVISKNSEWLHELSQKLWDNAWVPAKTETLCLQELLTKTVRRCMSYSQKQH